MLLVAHKEFDLELKNIIFHWVRLIELRIHMMLHDGDSAETKLTGPQIMDYNYIIFDVVSPYSFAVIKCFNHGLVELVNADLVTQNSSQELNFNTKVKSRVEV